MVFNSDLFLIFIREIVSSVLTLHIHLTTLASFFFKSDHTVSLNCLSLTPIHRAKHATGIGFDLDFVMQNSAC